MTIEFRKAVLPLELRSLVTFDQKIFSRSDCFAASDWAGYKSFWLSMENKRIGCCAFLENVDFEQDVRADGVNPRRKDSLYIVTTGILPAFQGRGFGHLLKSFQVAYAKHNGFTRIVTNTRKKNAAMITLNRRHHFEVIRTTPGYYSEPTDATVVMELLLGPHASPHSKTIRRSGTGAGSGLPVLRGARS